MAVLEKSKIFNSRKMDSRIKSANTQGSEKVFGYFVGPMFLYMTYYGIAGTYLNQFYTDVLHLSETAGLFLTLMPIFSKIFDAVTNVIMGRIIDKTRSRQGKARPWIVVSGVLITITGILLYIVPTSSLTVQIIWIIVSYNLFFAVAFTLYNMSHTLMVPLSTRNTKQRDTLAILSIAGASMIPGALVTVIMPYIISSIGVGSEAQAGWIKMMAIISIFAIPAVLLEYFFTRERVTEEEMSMREEGEDISVPISKQLKACLHDPYWLIFMGFFVLYQVSSNLTSNTMLYYCNWVLGNSVTSGATYQVLVNIIGQFPLGIGIFALWPLVRKFGKRHVTMFGFGIGALGCLIAVLAQDNLAVVLGGLFIRSIGMVPIYVIMALLADALDHIEWKNGFRADGISASIYSISITVCSGISFGILNGGMSLLGYIAPASSDEIISQPGAVKWFFIICFIGCTMVTLIVGSLLMIRFDVEQKLPQISADLIERHRRECEAKGIPYVSPEEAAAKEQEEQERKAEEMRLKELHEKCEKKGLNFEEEEAKYQKALAESKAKKEEKAAKLAEKKAAKEAKKNKKK